MALIKCTECNNDVSTEAKKCPKCGAKIPMTKNKKIFWGVAIFIIMIILGNIDDAKDKRNNQTQENVSKETNENLWILKGKEAVKNKLKDPDSVEFKDIFFSDSGNIPMTCGKVNSKNSYGGYTGFQRFVSAGKSDLTYLEEQVKDNFDDIWNKFCVQ